MKLSDPLFYVELAESCFSAAAMCESATGAAGLRKLGQNYLNMAEGVEATSARQDVPMPPPLAESPPQAA